MANSNSHIEILYSSNELSNRTAEIGAKISADYANSEELIIIGILKGSFLFYADLVRHIQIPIQCEFMGISSYGDDTKSSGIVQITADLTTSIQGKDVLIVEDIIDTGLSMNYLCSNFATREPKSVKICSLLDKPDNRKIHIDIDYVGFKIPNIFVVGYGLDLAGHYRNLPYVGVYHESEDISSGQPKQ